MNAADLTSGSVVDRYTIHRVLGEGGMAIVYQVEHNQLGSKHALKVLTLASRQIRERLLLEGRAQATLRHPNVVTVTDVVDIGGSPGLIMEYIEGPSLDEYLEAQKLSIEQVDHLARGILAGVASAHDAGLVHRDLKPANIMLSIASGGLMPKVTDFGLAKIVAQGDQSKTRTGSTMGTPHYMSPEQIDDSKNVGPGTDIWALGAILYEMLSGGERAFPGDNLLAIFSAVNRGEYTPIDELVPDLPPRMAEAIHAAMQRDISKRPESVQALYAMWTGEDAPMKSQAPMGPWDAGAISQARNIAAGPDATWAEAPSGETLADANTDSVLKSRAALIGVGGTFLGLGALGAALLALGLAGIGVWYAANLEPPEPAETPEPEVVFVEVEVPGEPVIVPVGVESDKPVQGKPVPTSSAPKPVAVAAAPPPDEAPAEVDPVEEPPAEEPVVAEAPEPPPVEPPPEEEEADTGAAPEDAVAEVAPVEEEDEEDDIMGLLTSDDPSVRMASLERKIANGNEDASRALYEVLKNDSDGGIRRAALKGLISLWDNDRGHWSTNRDAMTYASGLGSTFALPATQCYGRNGQDPHGLKKALAHSDSAVRRAAIDAAGAVIPRAPTGFDGRGFIEPYTSDSDSSVAKRAQKLMSRL